MVIVVRRAVVEGAIQAWSLQLDGLLVVHDKPLETNSLLGLL